MKNNINTSFFIGIILVVGFGVYLIFKPFLIAIFTGFVLSYLFRNWYEKINKLLKNKYPSAASLATCIIILTLVLIPLFVILGLATSEVNELYKKYQAGQFDLTIPLNNQSFLATNLGIKNGKISLQSFLEASQITSESVKDLGNFLFSALKTVYQGTSNFVFTTFVAFFVLYYLFKDGEKLMKKIMALSPLPNSQEKLLLDNFINISRATLKGTLVIAVIQGLLLGLSFFISGVSSPTIWGILAAIFSIIPLVGPVFVWLPVGLFLLISGNIWQAIIVFSSGALIVSTVDNILRPKLVGDASSVHPLLVFLSTIGGLAVFGMLGFLIGPVIVVLFISLLKIYELEFKKELKEIN
jgi:predicted PurR-regulated permease PerM